MRFQLIPNRLYYFDAAERESSVLILNTVSDNREGFTRREYERAREARQSKHLLGFLSERDFGNMVRSTMILHTINDPVPFLKIFFHQVRMGLMSTKRNTIQKLKRGAIHPLYGENNFDSEAPDPCLNTVGSLEFFLV